VQRAADLDAVWERQGCACLLRHKNLPEVTVPAGSTDAHQGSTDAAPRPGTSERHSAGLPHVTSGVTEACAERLRTSGAGQRWQRGAKLRWPCRIIPQHHNASLVVLFCAVLN